MMRLFLAAAVLSLAAAASTSAAADGLTNCQVRSRVSDANDIFIARQMADAAKARAFTTAPRLAAKMKGAGVLGKAEGDFLSAPR